MSQQKRILATLPISDSVILYVDKSETMKGSPYDMYDGWFESGDIVFECVSAHIALRLIEQILNPTGKIPKMAKDIEAFVTPVYWYCLENDWFVVGIENISMRSAEKFVVIEYAGEETTNNLTVDQVFQRLSHRLNRVYNTTPVSRTTP